jgi:penicillin-binding protein 2
MSFPSLNRNGQSYKPGRLLAFQIIVVISFGLLALRIYQLQFIEREVYEKRADDNRFDEVSVPATRGIITDRYGVPLAVNVASANVTVTPALLPDDDAEEMAVLERLASLLGIPLSGELNTVDERGIPQRSLLTMVREGQGIAPFRPVVVKTDVDHETARVILVEKGELPGVDIDWVSVREYPTGALTAHVIGYMGPIPETLAEEYEAAGYVLDRDRIGYDGVEFSLDEWLAGRPGLQVVERDVAGEIVRTLGESSAAQPGYSVELTIDVELQKRAQQHLVNMLEEQRLLKPEDNIGFERGVVIVSNPRTGEILALVSWPTYDNSRFARAIDYPYYLQVSQDPLQPLFNQAISSLYPPGSIFKMITLSGALEEGVITPEQTLFDPGEILLENRYYPNEPSQAQTFVCWLETGHGDVNARQALAWSCDVYFYKVGGGYKEEVPGLGLGIDRLNKWMEIYGLGNFTGIELAGEIDGVLPDPTWKRRTWGENWSTGDTYNSAFGQGYVLATPLQMINYLNIIADNGVPVRPTLVHEVIDADGNVVRGFQPDYGEPIPLSPENLRVIHEGMRAAVTIEGGTALPAQENYLPYVPIAAKTGTAEFCDNIAAALQRCIPGAWPAHAWYMSYAPYGNPEVSVVVFIYNGGEGSIVALPVASAIMDDYFQLKTERALQQQLESEQQEPTPQP